MTPNSCFRRLAIWFTSRLVQLGIIEDDTLNVVAFDGQGNQTTSAHTALAAGYRTGLPRLPFEQRAWWGCVGCRMLSVMVQRNHCWKTLNGVPMTIWNMLRACFFITVTLGAPFVLHWGAIIFYLACIAPFAIIETFSREDQ